IENYAINVLVKNNKNIASINFDFNRYTATINLFDSNYRVLDLDTSNNQNSETENNLIKLFSNGQYNENEDLNNNEHSRRNDLVQ
ncbi:14345_t:CDS:2, partial [Dentiscutata erythropus]